MSRSVEAQDFFNVIVLKVGVPTETGKVYRRDVVDLIIEQAEKRIAEGALFGETMTGKDSLGQIDMAKVSHQIMKLWIKERKGKAALLKASIRVLDTPAGKVLREYVAKAFWGIRAIGTYVPATTYVSTENFSLVAIDAYGFDDSVCEKINTSMANS